MGVATQHFLARLAGIAAAQRYTPVLHVGECDDDAAEWDAAMMCAAELARWPAATLRRALAIVAAGESSGLL